LRDGNDVLLASSLGFNGCRTLKPTTSGWQPKATEPMNCRADADVHFSDVYHCVRMAQMGYGQKFRRNSDADVLDDRKALWMNALERGFPMRRNRQTPVR
jgi:hypothetical protein